LLIGQLIGSPASSAAVALLVVRRHLANRTRTQFCGQKPNQQKLVANATSLVKGSPYSVIERRVPELIRVLGSQPAGEVSHKPGGKLPLLSARPTVILATLRELLQISLLGEQRHDGCEQFA